MRRLHSSSCISKRTSWHGWSRIRFHRYHCRKIGPHSTHQARLSRWSPFTQASVLVPKGCRSWSFCTQSHTKCRMHIGCSYHSWGSRKSSWTDRGNPRTKSPCKEWSGHRQEASWKYWGHALRRRPGSCLITICCQSEPLCFSSDSNRWARFCWTFWLFRRIWTIHLHNRVRHWSLWKSQGCWWSFPWCTRKWQHHKREQRHKSISQHHFEDWSHQNRQLIEK